ncbi:helix-turn-helix domain-containing protein [Phytoactinopolyspora alkaliphila]|uniref:helix-turn-helix domain-containing protein n=1 Tax=Phytoactinopolyspora alkaliphila TaxID=1783498 RepID=UPI001C20704F
MTSANDIARAVGAPLLRTVVEGGVRAETRDVFLAESHSSSAGEPGDLVLGVGMGGPDEAVDLVRRCAAAGASGLVIRLDLATHPDVMSAAGEAALPVIGAGEGISWAHLVWLLRGVIDRTAVPGPAVSQGVHNDMFALADTVAAVVDAPVTIEDNRSRVLAYSSGQGETDTARVATIVGRRVPEEVAAHFRALGVFRRLARSDEPFLVPEGPDGTRPRLVVPVRAGGEWLGSIWAVVDGPVGDTITADLRKAASVLALHLLRLRAQSDVARRSATELLRSALWQYVPEQAARLELPGSGPWRVVALRAPEAYADTSERLQLWETLARRHGWPEARLADLEETVFAVVDDGSSAGSWIWLRRLVTDAYEADGSGWAAAAGGPATLAELPRSRAEAVELLGLLADAADPHRGSPSVAGPVIQVENAWAALTVHRMAASLDTSLLGGPVQVLTAHDAAHHTDYVATLRMWLRHHGEPRRAARELLIHPNTLRYRMRRIHEVLQDAGGVAGARGRPAAGTDAGSYGTDAGSYGTDAGSGSAADAMDLDDPDQRLALQMQIEARWIQGR